MNSDVLKTALSELSAKTELANTALSNVLLASVLLTLVSPAQKDNSCSKENALPDAQSPWSMEDAPTNAPLDSSLKPAAETVSSVTTDAELAKALLTDVLHAKQVLPATVLVFLPAQPTQSTLTEIALHVLKDATAAETQLVNVQPVNQDSFWLDPDVSPRVMLDSSEMETTDAEDAQTPADHALQPLLAHHVLKQEINQSTVSAIAVFSHAPTALHTNNVLLVCQDSALLTEDVPANAQLDQLQSMELADAQTEFSTMVNAQFHAHQDGPTSMELANNVTATVVNAQERLTPAHLASLDSY